MQEVATILEAAILASVGAGEVAFVVSDAGAFQLRAPNHPSGDDYAITAYGGAR